MESALEEQSTSAAVAVASAFLIPVPFAKKPWVNLGSFYFFFLLPWQAENYYYSILTATVSVTSTACLLI